MSWFQTFGKGQEMEVVSQSIKTTVDIPCQECGCAYGWHEQSLEAIERVRQVVNSAPARQTDEYLWGWGDAVTLVEHALDGEQE
jgi:hypothetical protein